MARAVGGLQVPMPRGPDWWVRPERDEDGRLTFEFRRGPVYRNTAVVAMRAKGSWSQPAFRFVDPTGRQVPRDVQDYAMRHFQRTGVIKQRLRAKRTRSSRSKLAAAIRRAK